MVGFSRGLNDTPKIIALLAAAGLEISAGLVTVASRFGVPVSTTHVSCGSLFGLGPVIGGARWKMIGQILLAWVITLLAATRLAAIVAWVI